MDDLTQRTAEQLLALYREGAASPVDVTRQVLQRIARLNPVLNAYCWVDENAALASAQRSEQRWQAHRQHGSAVGALEGVPVSIKDLILTKGWPTLRGSRTVDPHQAWDVDAPATARLREAHPCGVLWQRRHEAQLWAGTCLPTVAIWFGGAFGAACHDCDRCGLDDECHHPTGRSGLDLSAV